MSVRIIPPFRIVSRISDHVRVDPDEVSLRRLRDVVAGKETTFPRAQAMSILQGSDFPNKHRDFQTVLENEIEPEGIRYLAAMNLWRTNTPAAVEILIENTKIRNERVLSGVVKALGRIGDRAALDAVVVAQRDAAGLAAFHARFAATLISHRLGMQGNELPVPSDRDYLELSRDAARAMDFTRASAADAEFCLRSLGADPFGIEFSEQAMYQVRCGRRVLMALFNRDFAGKDTVKKLRERKAFLGVIAARSEETRSYFVKFLLLTSPFGQSDTINILIYSDNGDPVFGGLARVERGRAEFIIRAVSRPGAFPVKIEGTFEDGRLEIKTSLSGVLVQKKRQPIKDSGPKGWNNEGAKPDFGYIKGSRKCFTPYAA